MSRFLRTCHSVRNTGNQFIAAAFIGRFVNKGGRNARFFAIICDAKKWQYQNGGCTMSEMVENQEANSAFRGASDS
jgi:hypothetical protein